MPLSKIDEAGLASSAQFTGFKNRIINGAMVIDQRNAGASYAQSTAAIYGLDRWKSDIDAATGRWSVQQVSDAPAGFTNSLQVTITTQESQPASARHQVYQPIEGYNISDLGLGTVNASQITASFWVKTSVTGIHSFNVSSNNYVYTTSYTVNSADTWEYKTITIPGATAGTWSITNGAGLYLEFTIGGGTDQIVTANTWRADTATGIVAGSVYLPATSGATWQITGVQLEKGSTATSFDYRPYGTELALCQRYYAKSYNQSVVPGSNAGTTNSVQGLNGTDGNQIQGFRTPVTMRASATARVWTLSGTLASLSTTSEVNSGINNGSWSPYGMGDQGCRAIVGTGGLSSGVAYVYHWDASAEL
jgi:hypothetical protein